MIVPELRETDAGEHPPIRAKLPSTETDRMHLDMSSRLTRIETLFEAFTRDMARLDHQQSDILLATERTAGSMATVANKLATHTEMEEFQWKVVNQANTTLAEVGSALSQHLQETAATNVRLTWLEKMIWTLWGVVGAAAAMLVPYALRGMGLE